MSTPTNEQVKAAAKVFCDAGFEIHSPDDGDLDDLERHWWDTLRAALTAALQPPAPDPPPPLRFDIAPWSGGGPVE